MRPIFWTFFTNGRRSVYVLSLPDSILGPRKQEAEAILTVEPQPCKKNLTRAEVGRSENLRNFFLPAIARSFLEKRLKSGTRRPFWLPPESLPQVMIAAGDEAHRHRHHLLLFSVRMVVICSEKIYIPSP